MTGSKMVSHSHSLDQIKGRTPSSDRDIKILVNLCYLVIAMIFVMIGLGGYTRLTGSGLSIVDWRPITGILPPLNELEWMKVFDLYKSSPEYTLKNFGMDLASFKSIFWLEYIHRVWGRLIGIVCFIPIIFTGIKPTLRPWTKRFIALWILGALQGLMGWYMVKSGLNQDPDVSPYRLCAHLILAFVTLIALFWTAMNIKTNPTKRLYSFTALQTKSDWAVAALILTTIAYGAFVAGMKAGLVYNTFPLMGGAVIPDELLFHTPWYSNFFMNPVTVQFTHRVLAISTFATVIWYVITLRKATHSHSFESALLALKSVVTLQFILGILTLLTHVNMHLAVAHQITAAIVSLAFINVLFIKKYQNA